MCKWVQVGFRFSNIASYHEFQSKPWASSRSHRKSRSKQKRDRDRAVLFKKSKTNIPRREYHEDNEDIKLAVDNGLASNDMMKKYDTENVCQQEESLVVQSKPLPVC